MAHLAGVGRSVCGEKEPTPVVGVTAAGAHIRGYGLVVCEACLTAGGWSVEDLLAMVPAVPSWRRAASDSQADQGNEQ